MADRSTTDHQALIASFFAARRARHGDLRMEVDTDPNPVDPPTPAPPKPGPPAPADLGFPADTPTAEMTGEQREAYWKHQAKQHETAWKKRAGDLTPEKLQELRDKAKKHDELEYELGSDKEKAVADAKRDATAAATSTYLPRLVSAEFRAEAAGRIAPERLATILEPLDMSKFLTSDGDVDTAKVSAFVNGIAPDTGAGNPTPPRKPGPSSTGQGNRGGSASPSVASGRELYLARHPRKTA
jgi:hypothetical protein